MARRGYSPGRSYKARFEHEQNQEAEYKSRQADVTAARKAESTARNVEYVGKQAYKMREGNIEGSEKQLGQLTQSDVGSIEAGTNLYTEKEGILGKITGNYAEQNPEILKNVDQISRSDQKSQMTEMYGSSAAKAYGDRTWTQDRTQVHSFADNMPEYKAGMYEGTDSTMDYSSLDGSGITPYQYDQQVLRAQGQTGVGVRDTFGTGRKDAFALSSQKLRDSNLDEVGSNISTADAVETFNIQKNQLWGDKQLSHTLLEGLSTKLDEQYGTYEDDMAVDNQTAAYYSSEDVELPAPTFTDEQLKGINENAKQSIIDRATKREDAQFTESVNKSTANLADADMAEALAGQTSIQEAGVTQTIKEEHDLNMQRMILDQEEGAKTYSEDKGAQYRDRMDLINRKEGTGRYSDPSVPVQTDKFNRSEIGSTGVNTIEEAYELTGNNAEKIETLDGVDVNETAKNIQSNTADALLDKSSEDVPDVKSGKINALDAYNAGKNVETIVSGEGSEEDEIAAAKGLASQTASKIAKNEVKKKVTEETKKIATQKLSEEAEKKAVETMAKQVTATGGTALGTAATAGGGVLSGVTGFSTAVTAAEGFSDAKERGEVDEMISQGITATGGAVAGTGGVLTAIGGAMTLTGIGAVVGAPLMAIGGAMTTYGGIAATAGSMYTMADNVIESRNSGGKSGGPSTKRTKSRDRGSNYGRT